MHDDAVRVLLWKMTRMTTSTRDLLAEGSGARVTVDGRAAHRRSGALTERQFDVALLDYNLGSETGIDLREARVAGVGRRSC
jgi:hypothetical protein